MAEEFTFDPVEFITIGTIGAPGSRIFHLQARQGSTLLTLLIEKEQAAALADSIDNILKEIEQKYGLSVPEKPGPDADFDLAEPILPTFRVAQLGLGYNNEEDRLVLVVNELLPETATDEPRIARFVGTREQMKQLAIHTRGVVHQGRPNPASNGYKMHH